MHSVIRVKETRYRFNAQADDLISSIAQLVGRNSHRNRTRVFQLYFDLFIFIIVSGSEKQSGR